jgi:hypothetical protein
MRMLELYFGARVDPFRGLIHLEVDYVHVQIVVYDVML